MNKLVNFKNTFVKSITSISYYKDIAQARFGFSVKYLYFLLYVMALLGGIISAVKLGQFLPKIPQLQKDITNQVVNFYPKDLVITVKDQKISTNVQEPYTVSGFIVIDTQATANDYLKYDKAVLVTNSSIIFKDSGSQASYKIYPFTDYLKDVPNGSQFNQKLYLELVNKFLPYLRYLPAVTYCLIASALILWPFLSAGFSLLGRMFILVFSSLVLVILAKIMKRDLTYGKIYHLSLHALTVPILLTTALGFINASGGLLSTLSFLGYMVAVIASWEVKNNHTPGV